LNRIDKAFIRLREKKQKAFIPYVVAGVPGATETVDIVLALEKLGADIIELGYPFSDPMADGVVNQAAANRALEAGVDADAYFAMVEKIRQKSQIPLIAFSYLNPLFKLGFETFARRAKAAGMDGILLVDMPVEESEEMQAICRQENLSLIFLVAPTTTPERLARVLKAATGFIYYISRTGITGEQDNFQTNFETKVAALKASSGLPVVVGFGISTSAHVRTVCGLTDGVVVGSALVRRTLETKPFPEILKDVLDFATPLIAPTKEIWN
jgi:tryptophan synthase alpha chain